MTVMGYGSEGNPRVNPAACTPDDMQRNWQNQSVFNNYVQNFITNVSGDLDTKTVLVSASDGTDEYLHTSMATQATRDANADPLIAAAVSGSPNEKLLQFLDADVITGWLNTGTRVLGWVSGVCQAIDVTTFASLDDKTVKVTTNDLTSSFLHDAFNLNATYDANADGLIATETVGSSGTNQTERLFLDSSDIEGYGDIPDTETWSLTLTRDGSTYTLAWVEIIAGGTDTDEKVKVTGGVGDSAKYLHDAFNLNATYDSAADPLVATESVDTGSGEMEERLFVDADAIDNYASIGDGETWALCITRTGSTRQHEWINLSSGGPGYRLIRGLAKGDVTADDATFVIDNVIPLANGADPVGGNSATEITLQNIQKEAFEDNTPIAAIYDGTNWGVLLVERYRSVRGLCVGDKATGDSTFDIDNIEPLESGLDPRSDTTSTSETLTVYNINPSAYADNSNVWADYNTERNRWEARPAPSGGTSVLQFARVTAAITAATGPLAADWGVGEVNLQDDTTGVVSVTPIEVDNLWIGVAFVEDAQVVIDTEHWRVVEGTCGAVDWGD